jgi:hypothetical protein
VNKQNERKTHKLESLNHMKVIELNYPKGTPALKRIIKYSNTHTGLHFQSSAHPTYPITLDAIPCYNQA